MIMNKDRLTTFEDAILAIIMTILVLELKKPSPVSFSGFLQLGPNLLSYSLSFFWIGQMWVSHHNSWEFVNIINRKTVWLTLILMFFTSLFPYSTSIVADNFTNTFAQVFYGVISISVSLLNILISLNLGKVNAEAHFGLLYRVPNKIVFFDISIKIIGLLLAIFKYPQAMVFSIIIASSILLIWPEKK